MDSREKFSGLLFELSSEERVLILRSLGREGLKLSHVTQRQAMTVTEAIRHF